jgi:hypothetical protein
MPVLPACGGHDAEDVSRAVYVASLQPYDLPGRQAARKLVPQQRHPEEKLHPGHNPVAVADGGSALDQIKLEAADIAKSEGILCAFFGEPLFTVSFHH